MSAIDGELYTPQAGPPGLREQVQLADVVFALMHDGKVHCIKDRYAGMANKDLTKEQVIRTLISFVSMHAFELSDVSMSVFKEALSKELTEAIEDVLDKFQVPKGCNPTGKRY